jgi:hypothetical protein
MAVPRENYSRVGNMIKLLCDVLRGDACSDNLQAFLAQGATLRNRYPVTICHLPRNTSFPWPLNVAVLWCCLRFRWRLRCCSVWGFFVCGWPRSSRVSLKIIPSCQFRNNAQSSASVADATMKRKIKHNVWKAPFNLMGLPPSGKDPMKKCPLALLRPLGSVRYKASEYHVYS